MLLRGIFKEIQIVYDFVVIQGDEVLLTNFYISKEQNSLRSLILLQDSS